MIIGDGQYRYEWIDRWAVIPDTPSGRANGRTHGVAVSESGAVLVFHQASPAVLVFDRDGKILDEWGDGFAGAHGMTLVKEDGVEYLWLTDEHSAEVVKTTLDGSTVQTLPKPPHAVYRQGRYSPTWVAVNEARWGGDGSIWVADGYGMSLVHRFSQTGDYLGCIDGTEGAGKFDCPHGLAFDMRSGEPELLVADRGNKRFQVYGPEGSYRKTVGEAVLSCPCVACVVGDALVVPELSAKLTILDRHNNPVAFLGDNEAVCSLEGWPNHRTELIQPGRFNSPHSAAADAEGNMYVVEWIVGGRITKLVLNPV
jgi:hypothetical protein